MSSPLLEACQLSYHYDSGAPPVLQSLNLAICSAERLALLGSNGAGKSTLFLLLNGILRPSEGTLLRSDQPVQYDAKSLRDWRSKVALVFQNPDDQLIAPIVRDDIAFGPRNLGLPPAEITERVEEAMQTLGLTSLADASLHRLSFGQRKRVALAGALALRPQLLLLDEPTAGLDHLGKCQLLQTLQALEMSGVTVVLTTHDVEFAYAWGATPLLLKQGQVQRTTWEQTALFLSAGVSTPWPVQVSQQLKLAGLFSDAVAAALCPLGEMK